MCVSESASVFNCGECGADGIRLSRALLRKKQGGYADITKKSGCPLSSSVSMLVRLRFGDCADGATVFACAAIDAFVRVDDVFAITLGDCRDGAGVRARSARNAFIADNSCHGIHSFQRIGLTTDNNDNTRAPSLQALIENLFARSEKFAYANLLLRLAGLGLCGQKESALGGRFGLCAFRCAECCRAAASVIPPACPRRCRRVRSGGRWSSGLRACRCARRRSRPW